MGVTPTRIPTEVNTSTMVKVTRDTPERVIVRALRSGAGDIMKGLQSLGRTALVATRKAATGG